MSIPSVIYTASGARNCSGIQWQGTAKDLGRFTGHNVSNELPVAAEITFKNNQRCTPSIQVIFGGRNNKAHALMYLRALRILLQQPK